MATAYDQLKDCTIYLQGEFVGNVEQLDIREAQPTTHLPYGRSHQGHATETGRFEGEGRRVRKDGSRFLASVVITALRDEKGRLRGFGKITRDITDRRKAEEQLMKTMADLKRSNDERLDP